MNKRRVLTLFLVQFAASFASLAAPVPPDLILFNGKIFTSVASHPYVQAVAIRGDRLTATGDSNDIVASAGSHTVTIP